MLTRLSAKSSSSSIISSRRAWPPLLCVAGNEPEVNAPIRTPLRSAGATPVSDRWNRAAAGRATAADVTQPCCPGCHGSGRFDETIVPAGRHLLNETVQCIAFCPARKVEFHSTDAAEIADWPGEPGK